ncbi:uncharacterized protein EAF01_007351 [Botrytis porri]|uniref:uncharacterized protein n=1 Tax=Botrytis porri TaxID=87229 RepID=UPI0019028B9D|nr:uncharacterized protein EAF01_007351 [Botrytis porri]KAF7902053.1 hypothetical protein EAF01_007351 [Botrytis porri]
MDSSVERVLQQDRGDSARKVNLCSPNSPSFPQTGHKTTGIDSFKVLSRESWENLARLREQCWTTIRTGHCESWIGSDAEIHSGLESASQASMGARQRAHSNEGAKTIEFLTASVEVKQK